MRARRSPLEERYLICLVAMFFMIAGLVSVVPMSHGQQQKTPAAPAKTAPAASTQKTPAAKLAPGEKVNINSASKEKLEALPEIGPQKAQAIIAGRPYAKPEDIMKVKGIKAGTYEKIKNLITTK